MPSPDDSDSKLDLLLHHSRAILFLSAVNVFANLAMILAALLVAWL
jgi:hypothetical protein